MAGGASEPLPQAQPGLAPLGNEVGRRPSARGRRALRLAASLGLLLSTAGVVFGWWVWNVFQVRTTNAYVVGNITPVSSDVGGQVVALYADDNMIVVREPPQCLFRAGGIVALVDRALADLRNAQAEVRAAAVNVQLVRRDRRALLDGASARRSEAERAVRAAAVEVLTREQIHGKEQELLASQRAQVPGLAALEDNARLYYQRFSRLAASGDVPGQDRDNRAATFREATAKLESMRSDIAAGERQVLDSGLSSRGRSAEQAAG
jgi:membrane fusion protein (multidrug efflux system)